MTALIGAVYSLNQRMGASLFGMEDMAGNVWEWCLDFLESYRGTPKIKPRGAVSGLK